MVDYTGNNCLENINQTRKIIFGALVLTATSDNFSMVSVMSKEEFNFDEKNHMIEIRAAIPLSQELVSQVLLSGKQQAFFYPAIS